MNVGVSLSFWHIILAIFIGGFVFLLISHLVEGIREEPIIVRGKIMDMDVNASSHTTKDSDHASTHVAYKVRFMADDGTVYELSTIKSVFMRVRPNDYGDAHIKTIFRRLVEFEPVHKV